MAICRKLRTHILVKTARTVVTDKILIVGSSGPIGMALAARFAENAIIIGRGRRAERHFDLEDSRTFEALPDIAVRHAVFLSALTGFKPCEDDPYRAYRTNVKQTAEAVAVLNAGGIPVTYVSSSAVFGKQDTHRGELGPTHPESVYGRTKRLAEQQVLYGREAFNSIVRITKLCDANLLIFKQWRQSVQKGNALIARANHRLAPLPLSIVIDHLQKIIEQRITGVTHLTSDKDLSYAELGRALFPHAQIELEDKDKGEAANPPGSEILAVDRRESGLVALDMCIREIRNEIDGAS
jgi:dTDP-4-dehydrorhamnose reductase